ncbi:MAG: DNA-binding protein, partial [Oscillospiraceae bacterium]|nr:DNA-binding protein [Oscillospiraceae bacterium]
TDHSNDFDNLASPNPEDALYDLSLATPESAAKWTNYKNALAKFNEEHGDSLIVIPGFEMTWANGPGHMNTFVTEGIVSRNNPVLDNKTADAGMRAYYDLLCRDEGVDSITQLNHPGATYGNFTDFAYWTPEADSRVYLVEVGNGEGAIRSDKYFPSYEEYTMALDKGWHVAPTNNQDNHLGGWGNANEARDVILVEEFTEEAIYDAIRNYRVYATEDRNLEITYTVNDLPMGTIMETAPETLRFSILLRDADEGETFSSVDLIANSGKVVYSWTNAEELASGTLTAELAPEYTYYYVRVIQGDKDIAVTAPVWVGENLRLGIKSASTNVDWTVVGEELQINTVFRNGENADAIVKNIVYTVNGSQVLHVDNDPHLLATGTESTVSLSYTPTAAKKMSLSIVATVEFNGREYTFTATVEIIPLPAEEVADITIDASHKNEYVKGGYADKMQNFTAFAEGTNIRVNVANKSKNLIEACENEKTDAIVINAPSRRDGRDEAFTEAELEALRKFCQRCGILILSGQYDKYDADPHTAVTMNAILEAVGSSLRFMDDSVKDGTYDGVYTTEFGKDPITEGLTKSIYYYGGSSLYAVDKSGNILTTLPEDVSPVLFSNSTASSADNDGDRTEEAVRYDYTASNGKTYSRMLLMAAERQEGKGMIFVSGASFMNDFNVTGDDKYGNDALTKNLIHAINPVVITPISEVQAQTEAGCYYVIEGTVTSNASDYHKDTAFFDCIYIQDETAGICCFPVAGNYKIGDVVRIRGLTDFFQGEAEIQVQTIEKIGTADPIDPTVITISQLNDCFMPGSLVTVKGYVKEFSITNGLVDSIYVVDETGSVGR